MNETSGVHGCQVCGSTSAITVTIRRHVGMIFLQRFVKVHASLCHGCGTRILRQYTARTLVQGWWGYISFFVNWFVLLMNGFAWWRLRSVRPTGTTSASTVG
jgi:hypothetical protein